jgi:hypothetical protein
MGYECEIEGELEDPDSLRGPNFVVFMTPSRCDVTKLDTTYLSAIAHPDPGEEFRLEPVVRDHETLYLCAIALDSSKKRVLGFGEYSKNPIEFVKPPEAHELEMEDLRVTVRRLSHPLELRSDRF